MFRQNTSSPKTWSLTCCKKWTWRRDAFICGVNTLSCLQYKNIIVDKNQSILYFPPHCGIQCSIPSKVCPRRKRLPLSCHRNSSQIFDATKLWKHTIPLTYNTKTLISNISETHCFSPQMRLIAYPDHKTFLLQDYNGPLEGTALTLRWSRPSVVKGVPMDPNSEKYFSEWIWRWNAGHW